jgi:hypothetical protein
LIYNEYRTDTAGSTTTSANSNPSCVYTDSETGVTTTYYEATPAVTRTVVYNLVAGSEPFKSPVASASYATSIATCPTTGTIPAATSTVAASTISLLTVKLSVKPAKQHTPVSASDCGIRLRNYLPTS